MKSIIYLLILIACLSLFLSCPPPEIPLNQVSVTSVSQADLDDYTGAGALPANKNDALATAGQGLEVMGAAINGIMSNPNLPAPQVKAFRKLLDLLNPKEASKSVSGSMTIDQETMTVSGNLSMTAEPIQIDTDFDDILDTTIGTVNSLAADFSLTVDPYSPPEDLIMDIDGNAALNASISLLPFDTISGYEVTDAEINAAADADLNASMIFANDPGNGYPPSTLDATYNLGAALSAGFTISSDTFVGKYIVEFNYSQKLDVYINLLNPSSGTADVDLTITIHVYDNSGVEVAGSPYTYSASEIANFAVAKSKAK